MKKSKFTFYLIFFIFHLMLFIFALLVDRNRNDFDFLFALQSYIPVMKYFALAGLILFLIDFIMANVAIRNRLKDGQHWENEYNSLKAKLYDLKDTKEPKHQEPPEEKESQEAEEAEDGNNQ